MSEIIQWAVITGLVALNVYTLAKASYAARNVGTMIPDLTTLMKERRARAEKEQT